MEPRTWTTDELEQEFDRRDRFKKQLVEEVREALQPELERMAEEISSANHVKQELAIELGELSSAVRISTEALEQHAALASHPAGAQMIEDLGLTDLSLEQRQSLPEVLEEHVQLRRNRRAIDRRERRRTVLLQLAATLIGTVTGTAVALTAVLKLLHP